MPIEIKELIIRTTVDTQDERPTGNQRPNPSPNALMQGLEELAKLIKEKNER